jgi:predicted O-methyltransferase YrrM
MLFQIKTYLKFLWHSKNEHAVHSPFVFSMITKCFYDKKNKPEYAILKEYKKALLENKSKIRVTDFGAGSKVFKSNIREIDKIAKTAGISKNRAQLLFRITTYIKPDAILELGTSLGLATYSLAIGSRKLVPKTKIVTLEGCAETSKIAQEQFEKFGLTNIEFQVGEFSSYLKKVTTSTMHFSLIYFDGNHQRQATLDYFTLLLPTTTNDTMWIFDDIHWSAAMEEAWETIKQHPSVTVTIDTFKWGLVLFRKEQPKEHFIIRV